MREIIEHCGQIGGRFEMPHAVGARLISTRATAAGERGDLRGIQISGRSRPRSAPLATTFELGRRFDIEVLTP